MTNKKAVVLSLLVVAGVAGWLNVIYEFAMWVHLNGYSDYFYILFASLVALVVFARCFDFFRNL